MTAQRADDTANVPYTQPQPLGILKCLRHDHAGQQPGTLLSALQVERVYYLYSNLPLAIGISILLALVLVYVQWGTVSTERLLGWLAVLYIVLFGRAMLFSAWKRFASRDTQINAQCWLHWFRIGTALAGMTWGSAGVLLAPPGDFSHIVYITFALAGLCAGGTTTLAIDRISMTVFLLSVLSPQIIYLALEQNPVANGMSTMLVLFMLFMMAGALQLKKRLEETTHLRHKATESESRMSQMLEGSPIAARIADYASNKVVFANRSYVSLIESTPEQVIGITPSSYYAHPEEYADVMAQVKKGISVTNKLVELRGPDGGSWTKWALASFFAVEYQGKPAILGWFYDITDRKIMEDRVEHMAYHDTLTGLPNRYLFNDRLEQAIANAEREQSALALLFVDLDKFKPVNDRYGHRIGDLLLIAVAERIRDCLRRTDSAARLGGDEFVVLLPLIKNEENALKIAENIRHALNRPFHIEGLTLEISSSTGVAIYPHHTGDARQLMVLADTAMYHAKTEGRNRVKTYHSDLQINSD